MTDENEHINVAEIKKTSTVTTKYNNNNNNNNNNTINLKPDIFSKSVAR